MERAVEVASFHQNELRTVTTLSPDGERRAAVLAGLASAGLVAAMIAGTVLVNLHRTVVHAPTFLVAWLGVAAAVAVVAARRAADRARRYVVGAALDADAFGSSEVDLVRRGTGGYELTLVPGMTGIIESGRSPLPVESLVASGPACLALPRQGRVWVRLGPATWVLGHGPPRPASRPNLPWQERVARGWASLRRSMPMVAAGLPVAVLATLLGSTPGAMALGDKEMQSLIPAGATPWEIEQQIRIQAQRQVSSLHRCFDPLPLVCQKPGFVGVGLSLSKQGEIVSHWVSRSTYAADCPVTDCMADSAAEWFFEPLPEPMRLVLPIQVKRTNKPLHLPGVAVSADLRIE